MGLFDSISTTINRGASAAERTAKKLKLKNQINDVMRRRQSFAAQLGASLYETTKDDEAMRVGREPLYDGIAACDQEKAECEAQIAAIEAEEAAAQMISCSRCGATIAAGDLYCSGCGLSVEEMKAAAAAEEAAPENIGRVCPNCGGVLGDEDVFCVACGTKYVAPAADFEVDGAAVIESVEDLSPAQMPQSEQPFDSQGDDDA